MTEVLSATGHHQGSSRQQSASTNLGWTASCSKPAAGRSTQQLEGWATTQPLDIPEKKSGGLPSSLEAARRALDPSNSPGLGAVYHGRFNRRKTSFDNNSQYGSPGGSEGAYQGRFGHGNAGEEATLPGITSTGDIQGMLNPTKLYHGKFGDTTGHSPPSISYEQPELARCNSSGRLHGNILMRPPSKPDPFGPDQEYHGPLE